MNNLDQDVNYALTQTWEVIGGDCLRAKFSCGESGKDEWAVTMDKEEVVDVVIDQIDNQGFMKGDAKKYWDCLSFAEKQNICRKHFQYETYGW